jgi:hypothetical protein
MFPRIQIIIVLAAGFLAGPISALPINSGTQSTNTNDDEGNNLTTRLRGFDIPIKRSIVKRLNMQKRGTLSGESGLGNNADL